MVWRCQTISPIVVSIWRKTAHRYRAAIKSFLKSICERFFSVQILFRPENRWFRFTMHRKIHFQVSVEEKYFHRYLTQSNLPIQSISETKLLPEILSHFLHIEFSLHLVFNILIYGLYPISIKKALRIQKQTSPPLRWYPDCLFPNAWIQNQPFYVWMLRSTSFHTLFAGRFCIISPQNRVFGYKFLIFRWWHCILFVLISPSGYKPQNFILI